MIYRRHYLKELSTLFIFIMIASFFLYMLIDCTTNPKLFQNEALSLFTILTYYFYQFASYGEMLTPLALLLSSVRIIQSAMHHKEFVALQAAGIGKKQIGRPFFLFATLVMALCYYNSEYLQPLAYLKLAKFEKEVLHKKIASDHGVVHPLHLEDHSLLVYNSYDPTEEFLFDLFWQKSNETLYKIEWLDLKKSPPVGYGVDELKREKGRLTLHKHTPFLPLEEMQLPEDLSQLFRPPKWQSLHSLFQLIPKDKIFQLNDKQASITTYFLYKATMPLLALITALGPLIYLSSYSRKRSAFLTYAVALFFYISFFTILSTSVILGENQILHPLVAICTPMGGLLLFFGYKYARL